MNAPQKAMIQKFLDLVSDHIATLEGAGFGGEGSINGAHAVDAVNDHFEELRDELAKLDGAGFMARECECPPAELGKNRYHLKGCQS